MSKTKLKNLNLIEITSLIQKAGFPAFRGKQIFNWLYVNRVRKIEEMKNLPAEMRNWLTENCTIGGIAEIEDIISTPGGTDKLLFKLHDGNYIEGVLMLEKAWFTMCISSQVGCALDCTFCRTGKGGFIRNLEPGEILDQILLTNRHFFSGDTEMKIRNVVFMGMGEPMLNLDNVIKAIELLTAPNGVGISPKRITVSTSGIIEGIQKLGDADIGVNLAISLNAVDDAKRERIMPVAKKNPISKILQTCAEFPLDKRRKITFEYVLIKGFNDSTAEAEKLARMIENIQCKVNLIPFNPHDTSGDYSAPDANTLEKFRNILDAHQIFSSVRHSKGGEINAACGQLAGHTKNRKKTT